MAYRFATTRTGLYLCLIAACGCQPTPANNRQEIGGAEASTSGTGTGTGAGAAGASGHVVLVLDDGFDVTDTVFQSKIAATYTITCGDTSTGTATSTATGTGTGTLGGLSTTSESFAQLKAATIQAYQTPDNSCQVTNSINFQVASDYASIVPERTQWNQQIEAKRITTFSQSSIQNIQNVLEGINSGALYHGTATAGLIAYQNPSVKLVLVQYTLNSPNAPIIQSQTECPTQAGIDQFVQLYSDPDVQQAVITAPLDSMTAGLAQIYKAHSVDLVNLSLGSPPRVTMEQQLAAAGCGQLDFTNYFTVQGSLSTQQTQYRIAHGDFAGAQPLQVQAAGNAGAEIDDLSETLDCEAEAQGLIMIGAVDATGQRSQFSNYGKCVDFYMLGQSVVVAAPEDFLNVEDGTSFAAPLMVRYITRNLSATQAFAGMITDLKSRASASGVMPATAYPAEIAFDTSNPVTSYSLTGGSQPGQPYDRRAVRKILKSLQGLH